MRRASSTLSATGFSTSTWQPRSSASSATFAWALGGVRTWITLAPASTSASSDSKALVSHSAAASLARA